jgi:hypothetical protein
MSTYFQIERVDTELVFLRVRGWFVWCFEAEHAAGARRARLAKVCLTSFLASTGDSLKVDLVKATNNITLILK